MNRKSNSFVMLLPGFPTSENDTTCLPMQQQFVRKFAEMNPEIETIVLALQYPYRRDSYKWKGIRIESFGGRNRTGIRGWINRKRIMNRLMEIHHSTPIVGMLSFWHGECARVGSEFSKMTGATHLNWIMGQDARKKNPYPAKLKLREGDLIALSDFLQDEFERNHDCRPARVITPGIDLDTISPDNNKRIIDILGVGSLISLKRFERFIQVVNEVRYSYPDIKAMIIGDGPERKKLEGLAKELDLSNHVRFTGELPYDEVIKKMSQSRILLLPSSYEGFSGVCLEGIACGCRVVSTVSPMRNEIDGWQIANSVEEMKEACIAILQLQHIAAALPRRFYMEETVKEIMSAFGFIPLPSASPSTTRLIEVIGD